jgi:hypothetical protein
MNDVPSYFLTHLRGVKKIETPSVCREMDRRAGWDWSYYSTFKKGGDDSFTIKMKRERVVKNSTTP